MTNSYVVILQFVTWEPNVELDLQGTNKIYKAKYKKLNLYIFLLKIKKRPHRMNCDNVVVSLAMN